ncbi:acyl-CoA dehydrogenase/oxidase [Chytridium lagenaria]|nr:acyl-CoA dehydrogenase/oxidase [Chytridium lagenaria]
MKQFSREDVAKHNKPDDLWCIIDSYVFDLTDFADMHPGSAVVLWPVAGKDATEQFYGLHRQEILDNATHVAFRKAVREFYDREIIKDGPMMDVMGERPTDEMFLKMGEFGLLACRLGPGEHLKGLKLPGGVKPEEVIGLPPVMKFGPKWMKDTVVPEVISGRKKICLAISDPGAGSDVRTADGKHFIVNGVKKWITNGTFCDYFTTAVRTGKAGMGGISVLLVPRSEGLTTQVIKTSGTTSAGTAYVVYENVKVPVENLIGEENKGFARWSMVVGCARGARLVTEECFKWACQRKVFGKPLIEMPVIRLKIGTMISEVEAVQAWVEQLTYQMTKMSFKEQNVHLAGPISLAKLKATRMTYVVSDHAVQIFGGRALTRTGMVGAILGGAEEVMADLGVRQALKFFPHQRQTLNTFSKKPDLIKT